MKKIPKEALYTEQEKLLYLEVEQLRDRLYLQHGSFVFQLLTLFSFVARRTNMLDTLQKKRRALYFIQKTPYAWVISTVRSVYTMVSAPNKKSVQTAFKMNAVKQHYVIFGSSQSDMLLSRSVQIARLLAQKHHVIYIEGYFDEGSRPAYRIIDSSKKYIALRLTTSKNMHLNYQKPTRQERALLKKSFLLVQKDLLATTSIHYIHHPFWSFILKNEKGICNFDREADFSYLKTSGKHIHQAEKILLKRAHIVTAPHKKLLRKKADVILKNGVEWDIFKSSSKITSTCDVGLCWIKKPVIGFIGTLDERIDETLLGTIAGSFPSASLVLVGNTDYRPVIAVAEQHPNIFPVGVQPYKKLPLYLQSFDILIVPYVFHSNGYEDFPELPLYLASGKPIISTFSSTASVADGTLTPYLYTPTTHSQWVDEVTQALKEPKRSKKKYRRIAAAKKLKWKIPKVLY